MDLIKLQQIHTINKSKKHQLLDNFFLYSMTVLTCTLFCSSPFWFPSTFASIKLFVLVSLPKISSAFLSSKCIFIVGNLIIIVLVGESKFFTSNTPPASDVYYNEYIQRKQSLQTSPIPREKKERKVEKTSKQNTSRTFEDGGKKEEKLSDEGNLVVVKQSKELHGGDEFSLPTEELNKRADDFIARVNRQRMLEARVSVC